MMNTRFCDLKGTTERASLYLSLKITFISELEHTRIYKPTQYITCALGQAIKTCLVYRFAPVMIETIGEEINRSVDSILSLLGPYSSDADKRDQEEDLTTLISWIDPIEQQHNFKPPPLRVKTIINNIINGGKKKGFRGTSINSAGKIVRMEECSKQATIEQLLFFVYFIRVRQHFFSNFDSINSLKMALRYENLYRFPQQHCFAGHKSLFENEIMILRKYLINKNTDFENTVIETLSNYNREKDFAQLQLTYQWISSVTESRFIIVDLMFDTLKDLSSEICMNDATWYKSDTVQFIYDIFYERYWLQHYEGILGITNVEERYEFLKEIKLIIISYFIRIRAEHSYDVCIKRFPLSFPTLAEMKPILVAHADLNARFAQKLSDQIAENVLKSTISTPSVLLSYLKVFKILSFLNDNPKTMQQTVLSKMVGFLRKRLDITKIVLFAMFDLSESEVYSIENGNTNLDFKAIHEIHPELMDDLQLKMLADTCSSKYYSESSMMKWFEQKNLTWQPDPLPKNMFSMNYQNFVSHVTKTYSQDQYSQRQRDGFDAVVYIIFNNNKTRILNEVIEILKTLILRVQYYDLDPRFVSVVDYLLRKYESGCSSDELLILNNLIVMLNDMEKSEKMFECGLRTDILVPKITSYICWDMVHDSRDAAKLILPLSLQAHFNYLNKIFGSDFERGKKLRIYGNRGSADLKLSFDDGRVFEKAVPFHMAIVINCFGNAAATGAFFLEIDGIVQMSNLSLDLISESLKYWISEEIVYCQDDRYGIIENLLEHQNNLRDSLNKKNSENRSHDDSKLVEKKQTEELHKSIEQIKPYVIGMLTNLGTMKLAKIHSFLKMTIPKDVGFEAKQAELKVYLSHLVQDGSILGTANGAYKLPKK